MERQYVEKHDDGYRIAGTRVSLDSVVIAFREGLSPETIAIDCFPTVTLEEVYGAITYYLANRVEIDRYLDQADHDFAALRDEARRAAPRLTSKLNEARRKARRPDK